MSKYTYQKWLDQFNDEHEGCDPEDFSTNTFGLLAYDKGAKDQDKEDLRYNDGFLDGETKQRGILGPKIDESKEILKEVLSKCKWAVGDQLHVKIKAFIKQ